MSKNLVIASLLIALLALIITSVDSQNDIEEPIDNVWLIIGNQIASSDDDYLLRNMQVFIGVIVTPEDMSSDVITAAWAYALINSEDEFGVLDYDRAVEIVVDRHPSWIAETTFGIPIQFEPDTAQNDIQEPEVTPDN